MASLINNSFNDQTYLHSFSNNRGNFMDLIPPDWEKAKKHAQSRETKPERSKTSDNDYEDICECCGYEINRIPINLFVANIKLGFLGSGFPLYFSYLNICILMLLFLSLIQGLPTAAFYSLDSFCQKSQLEVYDWMKYQQANINSVKRVQPCPNLLVNELSLANTIDQIKEGGSLQFSIVAMLFQVIACFEFRKNLRQTEVDVDQKFTTPTDYSVWIKLIPKNLKNIQQTIKDHFALQNKTVEKVNLIYNIDEIQELELKYKNLIKKKQEYLKKNGINSKDEELFQIQVEINNVNNEILEKQTLIPLQPEKFTGQAFVSFSTEQEKDQVLDEHVPGFFTKLLNYLYNGRLERYNDTQKIGKEKILIIEAPEPNDIDWEFAHCSNRDRQISNIYSTFMWILLMLLSLGLVLLLKYIQSLQVQKAYSRLHEIHALDEAKNKIKIEKILQEIQNSFYWDQIFCFLLSISIALFNQLALPYLVGLIVKMEKQSTKTKMNTSFAFKLAIPLFLNTALSSFFTDIFFFQNYYGYGGNMVYSVTLNLILNATLPNILWVIDPWSIIKNKKREKELQNKENSVLTQREANELMELPSYSIGWRYADTTKTMWLTFFFSPLVPICTFISLLGMIFYYLLDKYNLIYRRTVKESIGYDLSFEMLELIEFNVFLHCMGNFIFRWILGQYIDYFSLGLFCISIIFIILPLQLINEWIFEIVSIQEVKPYKQVKDQFDTDYERENPITKNKALEFFQLARQSKTEV
ncbi:kinase domain protein (macronuclear) [Tetrahymena thermophila SB210]|uniref:Kinase domain protein n=1 Tax=Tetrahymena thermophila (strain SB210) TaxID=312017 RepID=I7LXA8_TETTS|nr:kinase domain protein [Tetrahymena thermophila SB210]EAS04279.2 kinase domain protein [Tetrahymena thermophila SB210]|eukprot:XP_001024524.2 kinase domain protein [Tetrahymena thermophila SB210]